MMSTLWCTHFLLMQVSQAEHFESRSLALPTTNAVVSSDPGTGPWEVVKPEDVGLKTDALDDANNFIRSAVLDRQCFLLIKDGKIAYEWYDPKAPDPPQSPPWSGPAEKKPHRGWSMTKTAGGYLVLLAATEDGLDIDADITEKYGVPSPKPYGVTLRMMMSQVLGGNHRPGEMWRYDETGIMWLPYIPRVIRAATGHNASYYFKRLHSRLGLSEQFTWPEVDVKWYTGAAGSCRDWARFGQLILTGGMWGGQQLIASRFITEMQQPVKVKPYNSYSNPCYGLLIWINADKSKYPGCCWEASRLPDPKCNNETFMDGAVHDMTLNIGLYGQIVMTLASVNTVVVGFGRDLRPIEPARIGYYPGVCKALGIPCNTPPPVPKTKCGELLQCTGVSAQCFSGGGWGHEEPVPGKEQCVRCFQERLPLNEKKFPEAHDMVANWCPKTHAEAFKYIECFCGLTGVNANPFAPWPTTTTTTPPLSPAPPLPPAGPTPAPPPFGTPCELPQKCIKGLQAKYSCKPIKQNGGHACYKALKVHQKVLSSQYGCPSFEDDGQPVLESKAFCWCGLDESSLQSDSSLPLPNLEPLTKEPSERAASQRSLLSSRNKLGQPNGGLCTDSYDYAILKYRYQKAKWLLKAHTFECAQQGDGSVKSGAACMQKKELISPVCAYCFGVAIHCAEQFCLQECACSLSPPFDSPACHTCNDIFCKKALDICTGLPDSAEMLDYNTSNVGARSDNELSVVI